MNRVNKISITIMSAFLTIGAGSTFARGPIAPAGPAASSSGIDLGQPQVMPPAQIRKELGSPLTNPNAAIPAIPSSASGTATTPAMPGNPTAGEQLRDNRDTHSLQTEIGTDARANVSGQSDLAPTLPYDPAGPGLNSTPAVGGDAATRSEVRGGRDPSSVPIQENASARLDAVNRNDRAVTPDLPSSAQDKDESATRAKPAQDRATQRKNKSRKPPVN